MIYQKYKIFLLVFTVLIPLSLIKADVINTKHIYNFGDFRFNGFGSVDNSADSTPILNPVLQKLLVNGTESWKLASGTERSDVSVKVQQLVNHLHAMFYVLEYFNTTSNDSLGQFIFVSGSNENGHAAVINPPSIMSEPQLIYIYTNAGKNFNPFSGSRRIIDMTCSRSCLILTSDGKVYFHGGISGNGMWNIRFSFTEYLDPDTFILLQNVKFVSVAIGGHYGCETLFAVTNYGHVFSMGCYNAGLRGTLASLSSNIPQIIPSLRNITSVSSGQRPGNTEIGKTAAGAIDIFGNLWTWGGNFNGLLGWNSTLNETSEFPQPVTLLPSKVTKIVFGFGHALVTLDTGDIYCFGDNTNRQSDPTNGISAIWVPKRVNITENTTECFAAGFSSACILSSGDMYTWGFNNLLGHNPTPNFNKVTMVNDSKVILGKFSHVHAVVVTVEGTVNVWGENTNSMLAKGEERVIQYPRKLTIPSSFSNVTVSKIVGGSSCVFVLSKFFVNGTNSMDYWGSCPFGLNFGVSSLIPTSAPQSLTQNQISDLDLRTGTAAVLTSDGFVYGWGNSQAFSGVSGSVNSPVFLLSDVKFMAVGTENTYILFNNETLWGIGDNSYYQMALGPLVPNNWFTKFTQINTTFLESDERIVDIKAGLSIVFLLTNKGNVYGCGRNGNIERFISNSGSSYYANFVKMNGNMKFRKIIVGVYSSLLLISSRGEFYYFFGSLIKVNLPSHDSYAVDAFVFSGRYYLITRKGNVYTSGKNDFFETNPIQGFSSQSSSYNLYPRHYFDGIPYLGAATDGRATIVTREEYNCFGINSTDNTACSSHGHCYAPNQCLCDEGYSGTQCSQYYCNGISPLNNTVCSGRGTCSSHETCSNCTDSIGNYCQYPQCYGVYANSGSVCSGNGNCTAVNKCECRVGFYGNTCQYRSCFGNLNGNIQKQTTADVLCTKINKMLH